ncbi:MAG TPA: hypothetical protein VGW74_00110, partial [Propionibacteriaceae bacterium]|nr:hypothetical protein [Propionibacteriaceae bacterium]
MSVQARSLGSAGRPVFGRPVAAGVVALIATLAIGAPAAVAGETPGPADPAVDVPQIPATPPVDPPPVDPPSVDPPPMDLAPVDPPPVDPAPVDLPPVDPPPVDPPTLDPPSQSAPVEPPPASQPATGPSEVGGPGPAQPAPPPAGSSGDEGQGNHSAAQNESRVIQAVWQVQQGCRTYCHGTSQTQRSVQVSETTQSATAISGESGGGSSAHARNESSTIQFVWQMQIGCVAFCFNTSQSQEAAQQAYTTQEAVAQSALTAWAENLAETVQVVFQTQRGCEHECHGATQHQSSTQGQTTSQSATATALGDGGGGFLLPDWLIAYASNIGATIQTVFQYQEALCLENCIGDAQLQEAAQRAVTDQNAMAMAAPPLPVEQPPVEEPPVAPPPSGPTDPSVAPEAATPPARSTAATASAGRVFVLGWQRKRTVRRQELVLRAGAPGPGDALAGPAPGLAPAAPVSLAPAGGPALVPGTADGG